MVMHGICDALEPLAHLRLFFQYDNILPHAVKPRMEAVCAALDALTVQGALGGKNLQAFWRNHKALSGPACLLQGSANSGCGCQARSGG